MLIALIGLLVGIAVGIFSGVVFPPGFSLYVAMGILACMDSLLGGIYANMREDFRWKVFVTGFVVNKIQEAWGWCTGMTQRDAIGR